MSCLGTSQKKEQRYGAWMCATIERFQLHHVVMNKVDSKRETFESRCKCMLNCQTCIESEL